MNSLPPNWQKWVAENVLLQVDPSALVKTLVENGFAQELATQEVAVAAAHPYIEAARSLARKIKKRDWLFEVYQALDRESPAANGVERTGIMSRAEFFGNYYANNRPVIMQGALDHWPALQLWTPEYLKERYGRATVEIQAGRKSDSRYELNSAQHKTLVRFADYIDMIVTGGPTNDFYMTANNGSRNLDALRGLWNDIDPLPEYLKEEPSNPGFFWFGPAGTVTPLHHDLTNNFMGQVRGRKLVKLISPNYLPFIYNHVHCYSQVDLDNIDYDHYPRFRNVKIIEMVLQPGDLLFLPVGWWHYVRGLDVTITMTFTNFRAGNEFSSFYATHHEI